MVSTALDKLRDNGGFTIDPTVVEGWVTEGFAVSVNPERTRVIGDTVDSLALLTYVSDNWDLLSAAGKVFGAWVDTETGKTYLDVVTIVDTEEEALALGIQHGELAVYDIGGDREIRTGLVKA